jgi:hypothetical protein
VERETTFPVLPALALFSIFVCGEFTEASKGATLTVVIGCLRRCLTGSTFNARGNSLNGRESILQALVTAKFPL